MGAASTNVPTIMVTGGPMLNGHWRGEELGSCTDCWRYHEELRAGRITLADWREIEQSISRSHGHCMTMGTASTMGCVTEALGMSLPGGAAIPAVDSRRKQLAERSGTKIVELVQADIRPRDVLTAEAFDNAIRVLHAISGSTNGILHLLALAGRVDVDVGIDRFDELSEQTPWLANIKPSGKRLMEDFFYAGGLPALMNEIRDLLHLHALTVTGETVERNLEGATVVDTDVIALRSEPLAPTGGLVVLRGNLCPDGAILKRAAASPALLHHEGIAVVFEDFDDMMQRVDDPDLPVDETSVLVLKNGGPVGAPGMPEWGHLPIPRKLLERGVLDLVRISDARMSGTSYGTVVLHVAPESAIGGTLALVENGDRIRLDTDGRSLDLLVDDAELAARGERWRPRRERTARGFISLYERHVMQADRGCDFDFLVGGSPVVETARTYG
jgi:dihydroxy-acid dehydratase